MRVRYDRARDSVVLVCGCGYQDVGTTLENARSLALDHERRAHPADWHVRNAASHRDRHGSKSPDESER